MRERSDRDTERAIATAIPCPVNHFGGFLVQRRGRFGVFFGCTHYPRCTFTLDRMTAEDIIGERVFGVEPDDAEDWTL
jgi:ssDNA-binding Zn-finger/Zn-ribbon topoisomerase 1